MPVRQLPNFKRTVWFFGDPHIGASTSTGTTDGKVAKLLADVARFPSPLAAVALGDITQQNGATGINDAAIDVRALAFLSNLTTAMGLSTVYRILGNHDAYFQAGNRTMDQARIALGIPTKHQSIDLGIVRLLLLGPEDMTDANTMWLASSSLAWMVAEAAACAPQPCIVAFHAPLKNTMVDSVHTTQHSNVSGFFARQVASAAADDAEVRAAIASTTNVVGWVSGHTHPDLAYRDALVPTAAGLFKLETIGGRSVACLNVPSLYYNGVAGTAYSVPTYNQHWSCPVTFGRNTSGALTIETRFRNHMIAAWDAWRSSTVETLTIPGA